MSEPVLGAFRLPLVQAITTEEGHAVVDHRVPGLAAAFAQDLHRQATLVVSRGFLAGDQLEELRDLYLAGDPLPFVGDVMTATEVQEVLIADLRVGEIAGKPDMLRYVVTLEEYVEPPEDETAVDEVAAQAAADAADQNQQLVDDVADGLGTIEVVLLASGERDFSVAQVEVEGTTAAGDRFVATIDQHSDGLFRLEDVPEGDYTVRAVRQE